MSARVSNDVLTAVGLSIGAAVSLGFSRFAYALLLPPMRDTLKWSYFEAGALNTGNAIGYIAGAATATWLAKNLGLARSFQWGFAVSALVLLATPAVSDFSVLLLLRIAGGVSTAFTFILGAALAGAISSERQSVRGAFLVSLYVAGAGVGIVLSGIVVPILLQNGPQGWRQAWLALGGLATLGLVPACAAARSIRAPSRQESASSPNSRLWMGELAPTLVGYGLFGAGYAGFMTFVIALLQAEGSGELTSAYWVLLGTASAIQTVLWGLVLGRLRGGRGPGIVFGLTMLGTLPLLAHAGRASIFASAVLFGGNVMAGPTAIAIVAKRHLPPEALTFGIALLTVSFALGQALGPLLAGAITDLTGDIGLGLTLSPAFLGLAAIVSLAQRDAPMLQRNNASVLP